MAYHEASLIEPNHSMYDTAPGDWLWERKQRWRVLGLTRFQNFPAGKPYILFFRLNSRPPELVIQVHRPKDLPRAAGYCSFECSCGYWLPETFTGQRRSHEGRDKLPAMENFYDCVLGAKIPVEEGNVNSHGLWNVNSRGIFSNVGWKLCYRDWFCSGKWISKI